MSDLNKPPGQPLTPLELGEHLDEAVKTLESENQQREMTEMAEQRVRNMLGRPTVPELTPSQQLLAGQMRRVISGERLSRKRGPGFFDMPGVEERKPNKQ